ncbi:MAG TPA: O-fucosyltransferase family protein [Stellaceae bacterium]|nr:O-fucosyltransferase family protein [Stellaceae bacterium]
MAVAIAIGFSFHDLLVYPGIDLRNRIVGAREILEGLDPYTFEWDPSMSTWLADPGRQYGGINILTAPPTVLFAYIPFAGFSGYTQHIIWWVLQWLALAGCTYALARGFRDPRRQLAFLLVAAVCFAGSWFWRLHVERGQYYVFLTLLLCLDIMALREVGKSRRWLGIPTGFLVAFRPTAIVLPVLLWLMGERRAATRSALMAAFLLAASVAIVGPATWRHFVDTVDRWSQQEIDPTFAIKRFPEPKYFAPRDLEGLHFGDALPSYSDATSFGALIGAPWVIPARPFAYALVYLGSSVLMWLMARRRALSRDMLLLVLAATAALTDFIVPIRHVYGDVAFLPVVALSLAVLPLRPFFVGLAAFTLIWFPGSFESPFATHLRDLLVAILVISLIVSAGLRARRGTERRWPAWTLSVLGRLVERIHQYDDRDPRRVLSVHRLAIAGRCLRERNLAPSEVLCRIVLQAEPDNLRALLMLGFAAIVLGAYDKAAWCCGRAMKVAGPRDPATMLAAALALAYAQTMRVLSMLQSPPGPSSEPRRYLVISAWGHGFWSDTTHVLGGLLLAEMTRRIPVIYWGRNSRFGGGDGADAFRLYFEPVSQTDAEDLTALAPEAFFPTVWNGTNLLAKPTRYYRGANEYVTGSFLLTRDEPVVVVDRHLNVANLAFWIPAWHAMAMKPPAEVFHDLVRKYLHPTESIRAECDRFIATHLAGAPYIAIHLRGTDKRGEFDTAPEANEACLKALAEMPSSLRIFLLTDDIRHARALTERYGERIVMTDSLRGDTSVGIHLTGTGDPRRLGRDIMVDVYVALRAGYFLGNGLSNVSAMIALMRDWPEGHCRLMSGSMLLRLDTHPVLRPEEWMYARAEFDVPQR